MAAEDRGKFKVYKNFKKQKGDDRPLFQGTISLPGEDAVRPVILWGYESQSGNIVLSGRALEDGNGQIEELIRPDMDTSADEVMEIALKNGSKGLQVKPNDIVLFTNTQKNAENESRPDYWGYHNPGNGKPLMRVAAWTGHDRGGNVKLTGTVQKHEAQREPDGLAREDGEPAPAEPGAAPSPEVPRRRASRAHDEEHAR
ncbi:hypothetical protein [Hyphomicrobium sp. GJ21]|uniref:hypothetical protein n=1 Tax=Hyphomicrobium sp. GJ21 TaxID=113574 RepID=UPI00062BB14B|nr:hypothetical protein [Hyphomicrobium sp. GJ21]